MMGLIKQAYIAQKLARKDAELRKKMALRYREAEDTRAGEPPNQKRSERMKLIFTSDPTELLDAIAQGVPLTVEGPEGPTEPVVKIEMSLATCRALLSKCQALGEMTDEQLAEGGMFCGTPLVVTEVWVDGVIVLTGANDMLEAEAGPEAYANEACDCDVCAAENAELNGVDPGEPEKGIKVRLHIPLSMIREQFGIPDEVAITIDEYR